MPIMKLPKYLTRYEFRGVLTAEEVKNFYGIKPDAVYGSEYWVYLSCRKAPEGGKVGDYKTECSDVFIGITPWGTDNYHKIEHNWFVPSKESSPNMWVDEETHLHNCCVGCASLNCGALYGPRDFKELGLK